MNLLLFLLCLRGVTGRWTGQNLPSSPWTADAHKNVLSSRKTPAATSSICSVSDYGAVGDGVTDDSLAIQKAIDGTKCGGLLFPSGLYLVTKTLVMNNRSSAYSISGEGWESNVLWSNNSNLFLWGENVVSWLSVYNLAISSINGEKSGISSAFKFVGGVTQSEFDHLIFFGNGNIPGTSMQASFLGNCIDMGALSDTVMVTDCTLWGIGNATGVIIGKGSEVRISGGRIIGDLTRTRGIGVHCTGNNGGVHIINTDIIVLKEGFRVEDLGAGSNREIFVSQATFDSCSVGMGIYDSSYVDVDGIWAASSDMYQIYVSPNSARSELQLTGGTIFNGGAYPGPDCSPTSLSRRCHGIYVEAGAFSLTGVAIRNNKGVGVTTQTAVSDYSITGCRIYGNGQGLALDGSGYAVTGNVFFGNQVKSQVGPLARNSVVANNVINDL